CLALEANLSEAGNHVFSDTTSTLVFQPTSCKNGTLLLQLKHLGGPCDGGNVGQATIDGTLSGSTVTLVFSETGALGSAVTTASASNDVSSISHGHYSTPAACGLPEDHGTVEGYRSPIGFSGETYSGTLTFGGTPHAIVANFTSTPDPFDLSMSGTYGGSPFV